MGMLDIPPDFSDFLNSLVRPEERLAGLAGRLGVSVSELTEAAYSFIRQQWFAPGNDHYQVLGLSSCATEKEIRQRYRLLIGLFHPDRVTRSEPWVEQAVRMINTAYTDLKRPDRRRNYDAGLRRQTEKTAPGQPLRPSQPVNPSRPRPDVSVRPADAVYRVALLQRHPRAFVWGSIIAALLLMMMLMVMGTRNTANLTMAGDTTSRGRAGDRVPVNPLVPEVELLALQKTSAAGSREASPVVVAEQSPVEAVAQAESVAPPPRKVSAPAATKKTVIESAADKPVVGVRQTQAPVPQKTPETPPVLAREVRTTRQAATPQKTVSAMGFDGGASPAAVAMSLQTEPRNARLSLSNRTGVMQPETVLMQYVNAYENGSLESLLRLFTLDGRSNGRRGRKQIGEDYQRLFDATETREIHLKQVRIIPRGSGYEAWAQVEAQTVSGKGEPPSGYSGEMVFELVPKGKRLYITRLTHNVRAVE
ncbi:hypothetical protein TBH_C0730 [Thiolapillus brandeum]|uniref:J domain-containing protein n=1 Tax=Thiolapillus brandeum TaxID=1076588 RepID=A0A7U6GHC9_9GAMM|nr:hypothetical protein TBH_C0730 [Thiolapillus brandeum]